jgi:prepilin-type processing-associated H-X9-DG protein
MRECFPTALAASPRRAARQSSLTATITGNSTAFAGGANVVFADGSVHFLTASMTPAAFAGLITARGGEINNATGY